MVRVDRQQIAAIGQKPLHLHRNNVHLAGGGCFVFLGILAIILSILVACFPCCPDHLTDAQIEADGGGGTISSSEAQVDTIIPDAAATPEQRRRLDPFPDNFDFGTREACEYTQQPCSTRAILIAGGALAAFVCLIIAVKLFSMHRRKWLQDEDATRRERRIRVGQPLPAFKPRNGEPSLLGTIQPTPTAVLVAKQAPKPFLYPQRDPMYNQQKFTPNQEQSFVTDRATGFTRSKTAPSMMHNSLDGGQWNWAASRTANATWSAARPPSDYREPVDFVVAGVYHGVPPPPARGTFATAEERNPREVTFPTELQHFTKA